MSVPTDLQGTLRKVSQLSTCLFIVNTLVSLTICDVMGLGMGCVNCHIGSAILMNPTHPPFLFIPICLNAMTDLCINKCTSGKWPQVISNLGLSQKQFKNLFLDFFGITSFVIFAIFCHLLRYDFYTLRFGWILYFYIIIKRSFYVMFSLQSARLNKILLNHCSSTGHNSFIRCNNTHTRGGRHSSVDPCVLTILRPPGSNPKHNINTLLNSI